MDKFEIKDPQIVSNSLQKYQEHKDKTLLEKQLELGHLLWVTCGFMMGLEYYFSNVVNDPLPFSFKKVFGEEANVLKKEYPESNIDPHGTFQVFALKLNNSIGEIVQIFNSEPEVPKEINNEDESYSVDFFDLYIDKQLVFSGKVFYEYLGPRGEVVRYRKTEFRTFKPGDWLVELYKSAQLIEQLSNQKSEEYTQYHQDVLDERIHRKLSSKKD